MRATPRAANGSGSARRGRSHRSPGPPPRTPMAAHPVPSALRSSDWSLSLAVPAVAAPPHAAFSFSPQLLAKLQAGATADESPTHPQHRRDAAPTSPQAGRAQLRDHRPPSRPTFSSPPTQLNNWRDYSAEAPHNGFHRSAAGAPRPGSRAASADGQGASTLRVHPADMESLLRTLRQIDPRGDHTFLREIAERVEEHGALALRMRSPPQMPTKTRFGSGAEQAEMERAAAAWASSADSRVSATPSQPSTLAPPRAVPVTDETIPFSQTQPPWFLADARSIASASEDEDVAAFSQTQPAHLFAVYDVPDEYAPPTQLSPPTQAFQQMQLQRQPLESPQQQQQPVPIPQSNPHASAESDAPASVTRITFSTGASASGTGAATGSGPGHAGFFNPFAQGGVGGFMGSFETQAPDASATATHSLDAPGTTGTNTAGLARDRAGAGTAAAANASSASPSPLTRKRLSLQHEETAILAVSPRSRIGSQEDKGQAYQPLTDADWLLRAAHEALAPTSTPAATASTAPQLAVSRVAVASFTVKSAASIRPAGASVASLEEHDASMRSESALEPHEKADPSDEAHSQHGAPMSPSRSLSRMASSREYSASPPSPRARAAAAAAAAPTSPGATGAAAAAVSSSHGTPRTPSSRSHTRAESRPSSRQSRAGSFSRHDMDEDEPSLNLSWSGGQADPETPRSRRQSGLGAGSGGSVRDRLAPPTFAPPDTQMTPQQLSPSRLERSIDFDEQADECASPRTPRDGRRLQHSHSSAAAPQTPPLTQLSQGEEKEEEDGHGHMHDSRRSSLLILTSKESQGSSEAVAPMKRLRLRSPAPAPHVALYSDSPVSPEPHDDDNVRDDDEEQQLDFEDEQEEQEEEPNAEIDADGSNSSVTAALHPAADRFDDDDDGPHNGDGQGQGQEEEEEDADEAADGMEREAESDQEEPQEMDEFDDDAAHDDDAGDDDEVVEVDPVAQAHADAEGWRLKKAASGAGAKPAPRYMQATQQPRPKPFHTAALARSNSLAAAAGSGGPPSLRRAHSASAGGGAAGAGAGPATPGVPWKKSKVQGTSSFAAPSRPASRLSSSPSSPMVLGSPHGSPPSSARRGRSSVGAASASSSPGLGVIDTPPPAASQTQTLRRSSRPTLVQPVFGSRAAATAGASSKSSSGAATAASSKARPASSRPSRPAAPPLVDPLRPASDLSKPVVAKGSRIAPLTLTNYLRAPSCIASPPPQPPHQHAQRPSSIPRPSLTRASSGSQSQSQREEIDLTASPPQVTARSSGGAAAGGSRAVSSSPSRIPVYSPFKLKRRSASTSSNAGGGGP